MSPEQVRGQTADHRSDIFSFGAVLYEMLSGRRAFLDESGVEVLNAILKEEPSDIWEAGRLPSGLRRIAARCLAKRPEERFQSARDLVFDLEGVLAELGTEPSGTSSGWTVAPERRRIIYWLVAGALLLGTALGGAGLWMLSPHSEAPRSVVRMRMGVQPAEQLGGGAGTETAYFGLRRPSRRPGADARRHTARLHRRQGGELATLPAPNGCIRGLTHSRDRARSGSVLLGEWLGFWTGLDVEEEGELKKVSMTHPAFSPDGRWLAHASDESGKADVYVQRNPGPGVKIRVSVDGGIAPAWRADGRELFFRFEQQTPIPGELPISRMMAARVQGNWPDARLGLDVLQQLQELVIGHGRPALGHDGALGA
jgi:hypothetical protein